MANMTSARTGSPRILLVTPEIAYLPDGIAANARQIKIGAGLLANTSASIVSSLFQHGAGIHVAVPNFRRLFTTEGSRTSSRNSFHRVAVCEERVHLAQDRNLFYWYPRAPDQMIDDLKIALAFQREVINHIVPIVQPDLIHCMGWMTGLVPAMARERDIPCLFSIFDVDTGTACLNTIEDRGIDAAAFWNHLYYHSCPSAYEDARETIPVDFLASGVLASTCVSTVNPILLPEIVNGHCKFFDEGLKLVLTNKWEAGCAVTIDHTLQAPFDPAHDRALFCNYTAESQVFGKKTNKGFFQKELGLPAEPHAPLFFWPHHDDGRHGIDQQCNPIDPQLMKTISGSRNQLVLSSDVADRHKFDGMIKRQKLTDRVAWCEDSERMTRQALAAADFTLRPTNEAPEDQIRLAGLNYGTLPIGPADCHGFPTISQLDSASHTGNGFLFKGRDPEGLLDAIDRANAFYQLPAHVVNRQIHRIMTESAIDCRQHATADQYMALYEKMLRRPLQSRLVDIPAKKASSFIYEKWSRSSPLGGQPAEVFIETPAPLKIHA
jgi:starch synthase